MNLMCILFHILMKIRMKLHDVCVKSFFLNAIFRICDQQNSIELLLLTLIPAIFQNLCHTRAINLRLKRGSQYEYQALISSNDPDIS